MKALETAFRIKLVKGELVCWAQPATTDAAYSKLNASAWWALVVDDWWGGTLIEATRDEHRDFVPVAGGARYYGAIIQTPCVGSASDNSQHDSEVPPKRTWKGFNDEALVEEMKQLVDDDRVQSAWEAACAVAPRAKGGGTTESKAKRLHSKYSETENS